MESMLRVEVLATRCIRCASCAILAPGVFAVAQRARVLRQPTPAETRACTAAALVCPTGAVVAEPHA
jgi:ferredoxin